MTHKLQILSDELIWWPKLGVGYYPVAAGTEPYNATYFERFTAQADSAIGRALMRARVNFVARHYRGALTDVGIGSGAFIEARSRTKQPTYGWDVNPAALAWLDERKIVADPYVICPPAISLWDVMEHLQDFTSLISRIQEWVFVSLPIFDGPEHVFRSKHFRTDEHYWYFTEDGLLKVFASLGFECRESNREETEIGREDIGSFAFQRIASVNGA